VSFDGPELLVENGPSVHADHIQNVQLANIMVQCRVIGITNDFFLFFPHGFQAVGARKANRRGL
jgi:hypothetical protein